MIVNGIIFRRHFEPKFLSLRRPADRDYLRRCCELLQCLIYSLSGIRDLDDYLIRSVISEHAFPTHSSRNFRVRPCGESIDFSCSVLVRTSTGYRAVDYYALRAPFSETSVEKNFKFCITATAYF